MTAAPTGRDPVERYLDELFTGLRGEPSRCRRLLSETEAHLLDAVDAGTASGLTREQAAEQAVARFGPVDALVGPSPAVRQTAARLLRPLVLTGTRVLAAGLLVAGVAGWLAWLLRLGFGDRFLAGDLPGVTYTPQRCADLFEYAPRAASCLDAAASHHADEVVRNGVALGVLGVLVLGVHLLLRRRWRHRPAAAELPAGFGDAVTTTVLLAVAAATWLLAVSAIGSGRVDGGGQYLCVALVCSTAAAVFAVRWLRAVGRTATVTVLTAP